MRFLINLLSFHLQETEVQRRSRNPSFSKSGGQSRHSSGSSGGLGRGRSRTVSEGDSWTTTGAAMSPKHQPYAGRRSAGDSGGGMHRKRTTSSGSGQTTFVGSASGQTKIHPPTSSSSSQPSKAKSKEVSAKVCRAK